MTIAHKPDPVVLRLLDRLGAIFRRVDPVPDVVYEMGRAALGTRTLDEEYAELVLDSAAECQALSGVRSAGGHERLVCFESPRAEVSVQVTANAGRLALLGHVLGVEAGPVVVESALGEHWTRADSEGYFAVDGVPAAPFRLRITAGATAVVTPWVQA